jgi:predicted amidophosphoribosyltransferase
MVCIFTAPLFIIGLLLLRLGLAGRILDDHPICRQCGFDLTGKPKGSSRCAECGADLQNGHAVRIGHHQRRRGPFVMGLGMLALSMFSLALESKFFPGTSS